MFVSQYQPDVTIEVGTKLVSGTNGKMKYKGSPIFDCSTGIQNGYGGQYFSIRSISNSSTEKEEKIVSGMLSQLLETKLVKKERQRLKEREVNKNCFFRTSV